MKIFCTEYTLLGAPRRTEYPIGNFFMRSDNAITNSGKTLYTPTWSSDMHFVPVLVVRLSKAGKSIQECYAHKYYHELALGVSFVDLQYYRATSALGLDPSLAYNFDGSLAISRFFPQEEFPDTIRHVMLNNQDEPIEGEAIIHQSVVSLGHIHQTIAILSCYYLMKMGDCIAFPLVDTFTPASAPMQHLYSTTDDHLILNSVIK